MLKNWSTYKIDPNKEIIGVIVFDGASNIQLGGDLLISFIQT